MTAEAQAKPLLREIRRSEPAALPALVVDLDGTLVKSDLLLESLLVLLKRNPLHFFLLPAWLLKGKAHFKHEVARRADLDVAVLPYRTEMIEYLKAQHKSGRRIVLATASDIGPARQVAKHLRIFDLVFASDGTTNLAGESKQNRLVAQFGEKGFDYAANSECDLTVWSSARRAIVVTSNPSLESRLAKVANVEREFNQPKRRLADYLRPLRARHWLKNLLIFLPLFAAHRFLELASLEKAALAFLAFGCCASGGYLLNDLFDLPADRHHPNKRLRAFAAGDLPISYGFFMIPILITMGCSIGWLVSPLCLVTLLVYLALTISYSFFVRKVVLLDVILLTGLYTIRILAGSAAISIWPSQWLLAFSTFFFLSLALVKRYSELMIMRRVDGHHARARSYQFSDGELLASMGVSSGYLAVLVFALYINSDVAQRLYGHSDLMWLLCPLLLYWISHIWLFAHRGKVPDDPLVFATSNRVSRILILFLLVITVLAL